jgi:ZIP family zinc transporter
MEAGALEVVGYALLPFAVMSAAAGVAVVKTPGPGARSVIQHFAAGAVFAAVAVDILPELVAEHDTARVAVGMAIGVGLMVGLRAATARTAALEDGNKTGLIVTLGIDIVIDGLLIGVGFALGSAQGRLLALALSIEFASLGLALASTLSAAGKSRRSILTTAVGLAALAPIGAAVGAIALSRASADVQGITLAVGAVALMYLVTEELLTEAHESPELPWYTAVFFAGFLAVFVLETT